MSRTEMVNEVRAAVAAAKIPPPSEAELEWEIPRNGIWREFVLDTVASFVSLIRLLSSVQVKTESTGGCRGWRPVLRAVRQCC